MDKRYKHLNGEERGVILAELRRGASLGAIGALLGRSASTIGRELLRGRPEGDPAQPYCPQLGADRYRARRKRCGRRRKLVAGGWLHDFVRGKLIHRPEEIEGRLVPGHWEGDLIKGAFNRSAVGTVVERKTRYLILSKMRGCDRGSEMACHPELARRLKIDIWFLRSARPWQRGSNENTNGLRHYD